MWFRLISIVLVAMFGVAGCVADSESAGGARPSVIEQATDFYFLPPVMRPPAQFGDFVPDLSPVVVAEQLNPADGTTVLRTLTTWSRTGAGDARVRVHLQDALSDDGDPDPAGYFVVTFRSGAYALGSGDLVRVRVLLDGRQVGLADVRVLDRRRDARAIDRAQYGFVVAGATLRVKFRIDRGALATDGDGDGIADGRDNCLTTFNPDQRDSVGNGVGDACRCDAVVCTASRPGCVLGACVPTTGLCGAEVCIEDAPATFSGTVIGREIGVIPATVRLTGPGGMSVSTVTDATGAFSLRVPFAEADLSVTAAGFDTQTAHFSFEPNTLAENYHYVLVPNLAWFYATVFSAPGVPLPGASVTLAYVDGRTVSGFTGLDGQVVFPLQPVGVALEASATAPGRTTVRRALSGLAPGGISVSFGLY